MPAFLFTDMENSTLKWQTHPDFMPLCLQTHDEIVGNCIASFGGSVVKTTGDGFLAIFHNGGSLQCSCEIQRALSREDWDRVDGLSIRIGVHSGPVTERGGDFFGTSVNRAARVMAAGSGGQIVFTEEALKSETVPPGTDILNHGLHMLSDLLEPLRLYTLAWSGSPDSDHKHLRTISLSPGSLPLQNTPFVGRDDDLNRVKTILTRDSCRLLTLLAPGGAGKTRLALQAAADLVPVFTDGVFFIPLEQVRDQGAVTAEICRRMGITLAGPSGEMQQLLARMRGMKCLLILDNIEHLPDCGPIVSSILSGTGEASILATSRHRTGLREEWLYEVTGLSLPGEKCRSFEDSDGCTLFMQVAERTAPGFTPDDGQRRSVEALCTLLEGSPLGIELAASWVRLVPPSVVLSELKRDLGLLESGDPLVPSRQRTLGQAFDYSWKLLNDSDRKALAGASVFHGDFTAEAFSRVTGGSLRDLAALHDKSLLRRSGTDRFALHGIIRGFAREHIEAHPDGAEGLVRNHRDCYASLCAELLPLLKSGGQQNALEALQNDIENIREGFLKAAATGSGSLVESCSDALSIFFQTRSRLREGKALFEEVLATLVGRGFDSPEAPPGSRKSLAAVMTSAAVFNAMTGDLDVASKLAENALGIAVSVGSSMDAARSLNIMGIVRYNRGDHSGAAGLIEKALSHKDVISDPWVQSSILCNLGNVHDSLGNREKAVECLRRALCLARTTGDRFRLASILVNLGRLLDRNSGMELLGEALAIREELGDRKGIAFLHAALASLDEDPGGDTALDHWLKALSIQREIGDRPGASRTLYSLGNLKAERGHLDDALGYFTDSMALAGLIGATRAWHDALCRKALVMAAAGMAPKALETMENAERDAFTEDKPPSPEKHHSTLALCAHLAGKPELALSAVGSALRATGGRFLPETLAAAALISMELNRTDVAMACVDSLSANPQEVPAEIRVSLPPGSGSPERAPDQVELAALLGQVFGNAQFAKKC